MSDFQNAEDWKRRERALHATVSILVVLSFYGVEDYCSTFKHDSDPKIAQRDFTDNLVLTARAAPALEPAAGARKVKMVKRPILV